jgi:hypothetical protein
MRRRASSGRGSSAAIEEQVRALPTARRQGREGRRRRQRLRAEVVTDAAATLARCGMVYLRLLEASGLVARRRW